jgi:CheY-like chemotaxis protein
MGDADVKDDAPKQLGRIALKRRPAQAVVRPRDPASRHAQLVALSERYGVPALDLEQVCLKTEDLSNVPRTLAEHHLLIPVLARADRLFLAMKDPSKIDVIQEVEFVAGKRVYAYAAPAEDIALAIERAYLAKERGALHFVGPSCPSETLRKAGLLPEVPDEPIEARPAGELVAPELDLGLPGLPGSTRELEESVPEPRAHPATVSAYPPRFSSLPPALRGALGEPDEGGQDLVAAVQMAFDELLDDDSAVSRLPVGGSFEEPLPGASKVVLVADDEGTSRELIERALRADGYAVKIAVNGQQALRMIKDQAPDLLILAALLPEVHGFEIAQRLRRSQRYGTLPIVMIGAMHRGWRWAEDQRESCGVEHYIEHPLEPVAIRQAANDAVRAKPALGEPSRDTSARAESALEEGMLAYRNGDVTLAIGHLERGAAIDPLAYRLHFHLGLLLAQQGQIYDAIVALERAVEINARHFGGVKNLAILYGQAGFRNRAMELWQRGISLAPDDETRSAIEEHLAGLLSQEGLS